MVYDTEIKELKLFKRGKVRDIYELGENLLIVATDRISCFDVVLPTPIPEKGKILTKISLFWFSFLKDIIPNHLITADISKFPPSLTKYKELFAHRSMIVRKCEVIPFECVVRGYLSGSGWKEYKKKGSVCGIMLPEGLREAEQLPQPIFTPATKAASGHDENVDFQYMVNTIGQKQAKKLKEISIALYTKAARYAHQKGIIIADTKFEFGLRDSEIILVDETLTPDSSRFWPKTHYAPGGSQFSFDKQFVRDYLESLKWDKSPPAPSLPEEIVQKTVAKYKEALWALTGESF